jgi:hypothetical protein
MHLVGNFASDRAFSLPSVRVNKSPAKYIKLLGKWAMVGLFLGNSWGIK